MNPGPATEQRGFTRSLAGRDYPDIEISDANRIPPTGPVLLCGNHAISSFDPVLIGADWEFDRPAMTGGGTGFCTACPGDMDSPP